MSPPQSYVSINVRFHLQLFLQRALSILQMSVVQVLGSGRRCAGDRCSAASSGFSPVILSFFPPPTGEGARTRSQPRPEICLLRYNSLQLFIGQASSLISFINPFYLFPIFCSHLIWIHVAKTKCWIFKGASDHSWRVFSFVTISDTISPFPSVTSPPVNLSWGNKLFRSKGEREDISVSDTSSPTSGRDNFYWGSFLVPSDFWAAWPVIQVHSPAWMDD